MTMGRTMHRLFYVIRRSAQTLRQEYGYGYLRSYVRVTPVTIRRIRGR